jgi:fission process protein 1
VGVWGKKKANEPRGEKRAARTNSRVRLFALLPPYQVQEVAHHAPEWNALAQVRWAVRGGATLLSQQRALAYASECGEAMRPVVRPNWVRASYALSWAYVGADTGLQTLDHWTKTQDRKQTAIRFADTAAFHSIASMAAPALTIHTVVHQSGKLLGLPSMASFLKTMPRVRAALPTLLGLATIPFIVHPLDEATHWVMDRTVRTQYPDVTRVAGMAPGKATGGN